MNRLSTDNVDYLQRTGAALAAAGGPFTRAHTTGRRQVVVRGVGRESKATRIPQFQETWTPPTAQLLTGLYGYRIPVVFEVVGRPDGVRFALGTWSGRQDDQSRALDRRLAILQTVLAGLYPTVHTEVAASEVPALPLAGLALGVPTGRPPLTGDASAPWDRVVRAMGPTAWRVLVLAQPVREDKAAALRHGVLNEMRAAQEAAKSESAPSPLSEFYVELLKKHLLALTEGASTGAWRTACYLQGDGESYPRLASAWRSVFSGSDSTPEPVRVFDLHAVSSWAEQWALPDDQGQLGPGHYRRPFEFQSLLTSAQLAACAHLPEAEMPGFAIDAVPQFDAAAPPSDSRGSILVGRVVHAETVTQVPYRIRQSSLSRHVLVCGVTGAGKTTTIFQLLEQLTAQGVPFMVVEPAKSEYRALLDHPEIGRQLQVFTLGDERISPFRLNPFEVGEGVTVAEHLDVVRATMAGSFGMWTPLPQILERSMHEIYADRGWDLVSDTNRRSAGRDARAMPTLADLAAKVSSVIPTLGYEDRIRGDLEAALTTRLDSLRAGGKGRMLDVRSSTPIDLLLNRPTIIELDAMGDDDDKAFLMGLLLVRLVQHRRHAGATSSLRHVLVIEEAHRLLSARGPRGSQEEADPRGKVVEMFSNMLSEVRAYGQGIVIADQVPVRLAPDALKNTGLKIAHRTVANDDREALGGAMAMTKEQQQRLASLPTGRAAVFGDGDDAPLLLQMPETKERLLAERPSNDRIAAHMAGWHQRQGLDDGFTMRPGCTDACRKDDDTCRTARRMVETPAVQGALSRLVVSTLDDPGAMDRLWPDLVQVVRAQATMADDEAALLAALAGHGAHWFGERRGAQSGWSYADTDTVIRLLTAALAETMAEPESATGGHPGRIRFIDHARALHRRNHAPYPGCDLVCRQNPPVCLYRSAAADLVATGRYQAAWREADAADANSPDPTRERTWYVCKDAGYELVEWPEDDWDPELFASVAATASRASLCFAQQMLADDDRKIARTVRRTTAAVLEEADLW